jgi:hypothetical protein
MEQERTLSRQGRARLAGGGAVDELVGQSEGELAEHLDVLMLQR